LISYSTLAVHTLMVRLSQHRRHSGRQTAT